jgi:hypothetical protein
MKRIFANQTLPSVSVCPQTQHSAGEYVIHLGVNIAAPVG